MKYFYEFKSPDYSYNVGAEFSKGKLHISDWALGSSIEKMHGDSDIEHFMIISSGNVYRFVRACADWANAKKPKKDASENEMIETLYGIFKDKKDSFMTMKSILKNNNIPYDFQVW